MLPDSFDEFMKGASVMLMLERHSFRADYSRKKLQEVGFNNITYFHGTDGFTEDLPSVCAELNVKIMDDIIKEKGSAGFTLSCIRLWKKILDENLPFLIIFEDDALPHPAFNTIAKTWYDKTPKNIDLLYLGAQGDPSEGTYNHIIQIPCFCTHAYVVTNAGAKRLMELVQIESSGKGVNKGDCAIIEWMWKKLLNWSIWNWKGSDFTFPFPLKEPRDATMDSSWPWRENGLIYQNSFLGSTIHSKEIHKQ